MVGDRSTLWPSYLALFPTLVFGNLIVDAFFPGHVPQFDFGAAPLAHAAHLWGFLGMILVGFGSILLGGCPFRQLVAAGQGHGDAAMCVMGLLAGAALCHNFGLAAAPATAESIGGPSAEGMAAVLLGLVVCAVLGLTCRRAVSPR